MLLSEKIQNFILHIYNNDCQVTRESQYLVGYQFYTICWYLRDKKLIEEKKYNKKRQKIWVLTEKGKKLAELIKQIKVVIDEQ